MCALVCAWGGRAAASGCIVADEAGGGDVVAGQNGGALGKTRGTHERGEPLQALAEIGLPPDQQIVALGDQGHEAQPVLLRHRRDLLLGEILDDVKEQTLRPAPIACGHGDGEIQGAQTWLESHFSVANPVEEMIKRSKLAERTFKRRFAAATGLTPIAYVQRLRVEDAKRRLERTDTSVDEISWRVGYEDAAFFRRLFKRTTGMAPGAYRKRFQIPEFARP